MSCTCTGNPKDTHLHLTNYGKHELVDPHLHLICSHADMWFERLQHFIEMKSNLHHGFLLFFCLCSAKTIIDLEMLIFKLNSITRVIKTFLVSPPATTSVVKSTRTKILAITTLLPTCQLIIWPLKWRQCCGYHWWVVCISLNKVCALPWSGRDLG